uniref:non-specific serine/threonine protein kinase n=1 Tax=Kalanchoe fedtschenkoi TaxID=63787 RepID=A0A7N0ZTN0_KALFE
MNQNSWHICALLWICSSQICLCVFDKFEKCAPIPCGDIPDVSYPFYIQDKQPSYCGQQGFNLSCTRGSLRLSIVSNTFLVRQIFYHNRSLRVSDAGFLNIAQTCSPPARNLSLGGIRFNFTTGREHWAGLYSDCPSKLPPNLTSSAFRVNCTVSGGKAPILAVLGGDPRAGFGVSGCKKSVWTRVEVDGGGFSDKWRGYEEAVRRGLVLNWKATNCSHCRSTGGRCGFDEKDYRFWCYCPDRAHPIACRSPSGNTWLNLEIGSAIAGAGLLICLAAFALWLWRRHNRALSRHILRNPTSRSELERGSIYFGIPVFSYQELEQATNKFDPDRELGDGGFGTVYHGVLKDGREVAVKRLYEHNYRRVEQFMNEVEILTKMRHKNLVSLYGCTSRRSRELLLVYEYVPNGTVADHLHGDRAQHSPLTWSVRMSIAMETASALAYLHANEIIHRDVKTDNILLDSNFCVKVADFGLSRLFPTDMTHVSTAPQGTPGYVDPEYHLCYQLSEKSDVYSFGVVLIELISSLQAVDISRDRHEINLANLAITKIQNCALHELIDHSLGYESDVGIRRMTSSVAELAFRCLQQDKEMRPSMDEVVEVLKAIESTNHETEKLSDAEEKETYDDEVMNIHPLPSPEMDKAVLLKKRIPPASPNSVTDKWSSRSTTPNTSA